MGQWCRANHVTMSRFISDAIRKERQRVDPQGNTVQDNVGQDNVVDGLKAPDQVYQEIDNHEQFSSAPYPEAMPEELMNISFWD